MIQLDLLRRGYAEYFAANGQDVRLFGLGIMVFPIGVVIAAVGATRRQLFGLGALVLVSMGPLFLAGFRGPTIVQVVTLLAVWARKDRRTAHRLAIGIAALAVVLVPAIRMTRETSAATSPRTSARSTRSRSCSRPADRSTRSW